MATANESRIGSRKQSMVGCLCQNLSIDPKIWLDATADNDVKSLCSKILKAGENEGPLKNNDEIMKWIAFAESFPVDFEACFGVTSGLNDDLASKSVLCGDGLKPSAADVVVFSALYSFLISLSNSDRQKFPHVMRWMDYIQNKEDLGKIFEKLSLEKATFEPYVCKAEPKVVVDSNAKNVAQTKKNADNVEGNQNSEKTAAVKKKVSGETKAAEESKKLPEKEVVEKDKEVSELSVSLLKIQVGLIRKAWKHPSADSLLVEEIDVGDAKLRQVVSGLAKFFSPEQLTNRRVVLITNVKPGKLRDVMSEGLVLCSSNEDHSVVEPLLPPEGAKLGECISFSGHEGKPEDVLNPKKKQLEKITPHLATDVDGVAKFKGIPFMTTAGPCTSSIPNATIK